MRGGAIPVLAWGTLLLILFIGNWIWDDKPVNAATAAFAAMVIYIWAVVLWLRRREAIRRGPPEPQTEAEAVPDASAAAVLIALGAASILFGLVWAKFFVFFGAGVLVLALGRLALELRAERASRERARGAEQP